MTRIGNDSSPHLPTDTHETETPSAAQAPKPEAKSVPEKVWDAVVGGAHLAHPVVLGAETLHHVDEYFEIAKNQADKAFETFGKKEAVANFARDAFQGQRPHSVGLAARKVVADAAREELAAHGKFRGAEAFEKGAKTFGKVAMVATGVVAAVEQTEKSYATTKAGVVADALLAGGASMGLSKGPGLAAADAFLLDRAFTTALSATSTSVVTLTEAVVTGDTSGLERLQKDAEAGKLGLVHRTLAAAGAATTGDTLPMEKLHQDAKAGKLGGDSLLGKAYGKALQAGAEAGEFWSQHGVQGGLDQARAALKELF